MKTRLIIFLILIIAAFSFFKVRQISKEGIQLSAKEFLEKARKLNRAESMSSLRFEGIKENRAYLHSWKMNRFPRRIQYWTPLGEFDEGTQKALKEELGRWSRENHLELSKRNKESANQPDSQ